MTDKTIPITYIPNFVEDPNKVFNLLSSELDWIHHDKVPRQEYYCNDFQEPYQYGLAAFARTYNPQPYHTEILKIRAKLEVLTGRVFEVCFLNRYIDQSNHLGWHADDSPEMDDNRHVVSVSLGVEREIWFRPNDDTQMVGKVKLQHGSALLMHPGMQDTHMHRIPKASFMCGERISLTFRGYVKNGS